MLPSLDVASIPIQPTFDDEASLYATELDGVTIVFDRSLLHGLARASPSERKSLEYSSVSLVLTSNIMVKIPFPVPSPPSPRNATSVTLGTHEGVFGTNDALTENPTGIRDGYLSSRSLGRSMACYPSVDCVTARQEIAAQLMVSVDQLIIQTPADEFDLYHCFSAKELGNLWLVCRRIDGTCSDIVLKQTHTCMAKSLAFRLEAYLRSIGRHDQANDIAWPGNKTWPGSAELPHLAKMMCINIVEHDLVHPAQPSLMHCAGASDTMHIGYIISERDRPHWVLLRTGSDPTLQFPSNECNMMFESIENDTTRSDETVEGFEKDESAKYRTRDEEVAKRQRAKKRDGEQSQEEAIEKPESDQVASSIPRL